ncbi:AAA family ATPase [Acinetobacter pittii]|uniref:AAA family ATPase n=1 Tax=Acinetobacter pittii TaxID=48296 RepID=UPI0021CDB692|nr:AAA family ATPase [Acinetobacter pittii]MCU4548036.1 AAA family ATPase [Acinetobacter pittii]
MEYFSTVSAICRASMKSPSNALINHIKKLIKALEKDNQNDQAQVLKEIIANQSIETELKPSRIALSKMALGGEILPLGLKPPVDKESGNYLAEILSPQDFNLSKPTFDPILEQSINYLLEEWRNVDKLKENGLNPAYSLMLFGLPGTGKTLLATYLASQLNLPLVVAKLDGLLSSFLGTTARNIANLFTFVNRYQCILLLDEFDAIAKLRDDPNELGELKRVVNTLLQCLDERSRFGYTIAITNHENLLDPAIWRRFDLRIEIPKPTIEVRKEIINSLAKQIINFSEVQIIFLAKLTQNYSGSDITKLMGFLNRKKILANQDFNFINTIKEFVKLNANLTNTEFVNNLNSDDENLVKFLKHNAIFQLTQTEIAELLNTTQPNVSRLLNK